jgi:hypothetical protein
MSKQRFFKEHDSQIKNEIARIVLKRQQYKCSVCNAKHNTQVIRTGSEYSDPIDEHELSYYTAMGIKPIKIFLRVLQINGIPGTIDTEDYTTFCPMHAQSELKQKIIAVKKKNIGDLSNFRVRHIQEVKNFVFQCTGKMMVTKDCIGLIMRFEQVLKNK